MSRKTLSLVMVIPLTLLTAAAWHVLSLSRPFSQMVNSALAVVQHALKSFGQFFSQRQSL